MLAHGENTQIGRSSDNRALRYRRGWQYHDKSLWLSSVAQLKVAPANVMTIIVRPFISSPPCARFARRLAHSHGSLR